MNIMDVLELIGVAAFAISGATMAINKKMDLFGILFLAATTAIGGGVIRDVVMDVGVPVFFQRYEYIVVIVIAAVFVAIFRKSIRWRRIFFVFDAIGLAVFSVYTGVKAIGLEYNFLSFVFMCLITGVGGGILRDIMAGEVPVVLKKEIYATASILGSVLLWFIYPWLGEMASSYIAITFIIGIRALCKWRKINLPFARETDEGKDD